MKKLPHKERNERIPIEDVDLLGYDRLLNKILFALGKKYGQWVFDLKEELLQEGIIGLIKAHKAYDPERGTFVTIAYLKVHTEMVRFINAKAKQFVIMNDLENLHVSLNANEVSSMITWEDLIPSNQVDYLAVAKISIKEDDHVGWLLFNALCNGMKKSELPKHIGLSVKDTQRRRKKLREDMIAVVEELYGESVMYLTK